jgi:eukaryotic-like serine/threonine-protein kinase
MGDYVKIGRLGAGHFGEVWLAFHQALGVRHAVKYVPESNVENPTEFFKEPQLLKRLEHPNIVKVEDAGKTADGNLFIAMEYMRAGSLQDRFKGRPINMKRIKPLVCEALRGLQHAHDKGYIHRDIKPANILITKLGTGKISDFGLATSMSRTGAASPQGYLLHLAPEVITEDSTSILSDVYAVGMTLYRMINGDAYLRQYRTEDELDEAIIDGTFPDRRKYRLYVPQQLRKVINKALSVQPSGRYRSADQLRYALEQVRIERSWRETVEDNEIEWRSETTNDVIRVLMRYVGSDKWNVETTKMLKKTGASRRTNALCLRSATRTEARTAVEQITSGFASGKPPDGL